MKEATGGDRDVRRISADECFWSVVEAPQWQRKGQVPDSLLDEAILDMPVAAGDVFAVGAPDGHGRLVVCACRRDAITKVPAELQRWNPDGVPSELGAACDPEEFNLLVGEYEPRSQRLHRWRMRWATACVLAAIAGMLVMGAGRRAEHAKSARAGIDAATAALLSSSGFTDESAVRAELERMRVQEAAAALVRRPIDVTPALGAILAAWPGEVASRPGSIGVGESAATVNVTVDGDPSEFLRAFKAPNGWALEQPRVNTTGGATRIALQLRAREEAGR